MLIVFANKQVRWLPPLGPNPKPDPIPNPDPNPNPNTNPNPYPTPIPYPGPARGRIDRCHRREARTHLAQG